MTVPSVRISLDKSYELRFEQPDVVACEDDMNMGYLFFFRVEKMGTRYVPVVLSLKLLRSLIHRGLRTRDMQNNLVYALPQNEEGKLAAGTLIQQFKQNVGQDIEIWELCRQAFADWFAPAKPGEKPAIPEGDAAKNSPGAG